MHEDKHVPHVSEEDGVARQQAVSDVIEWRRRQLANQRDEVGDGLLRIEYKVVAVPSLAMVQRVVDQERVHGALA